MSGSEVSGRRRPIQLRSVATRQAVLDAARTVVLERGRDRLTTATVAERAGVSIGTFYRYFADKADLVEQLFQCYPDIEQGPVLTALEQKLILTATKWGRGISRGKESTALAAELKRIAIEMASTAAEPVS